MSNSSTVETFYTVFMELLNDISTIKPNDPTLMMVKAAVSVLSTEMIINQFMNYTEPYKEKILNKDESFFINEIHKDVKDNSFAAREINKVRDIWCDPETTNDTKQCIWKYFTVLIKLGLKHRYG